MYQSLPRLFSFAAYTAFDNISQFDVWSPIDKLGSKMNAFINTTKA